MLKGICDDMCTSHPVESSVSLSS